MGWEFGKSAFDGFIGFTAIVFWHAALSGKNSKHFGLEINDWPSYIQVNCGGESTAYAEGDWRIPAWDKRLAVAES